MQQESPPFCVRRDTIPPGLTTRLARERLATEGANALPAGGSHGTWAMVREVIRELMFLLLLVAAGSSTLLASLRTPNPALWRVIGGTLGLLAFVLYAPGLREVFGFTYLHATDVLPAFAAGATGIVWLELFKWAKGTAAKGAPILTDASRASRRENGICLHWYK